MPKPKSPKNTAPTTTASNPSRWGGLTWFLGALALLGSAAWIVYGRALDSPFIFDDWICVVNNASVAKLWPLLGDAEHPGPLMPPKDLPTSGRPLVNFSLALNYHFGRLDPLGYHIFNLIVHVLSALLLMAIVRRSLCLDYFRGKFNRSSGPLALAVALLWTVHPLQTETVIYTTQRTELLLGFFYLATLYGSMRYWAAPLPAGRTTWLVLTTLACLAGMACKEVMVTAPVIVLLFERTFVAGSFRQALRKSWPLYVGLAATWSLLLLLNLTAPRSGSAGFHLGVPATDWWLTQTRILWTYLKLAILPFPLTIHYEMPYLTTVMEAGPWLVLTALLIIVTLLLLGRRNPIGFVGACVLLILSPTLVVPIITEVAAERRMYLPQAALIALAVCGGYALAKSAADKRLAGSPGRRSGSFHQWPFALVITIVLLLTVVFSLMSIRRLEAYSDELTLWQGAVVDQPDDSLARNNLGIALNDAGRPQEAIVQFKEALRLKPKYAEAHYNLGLALSKLGKPQEAIQQYQQALEIRPNYADACNNLAWIFANSPDPQLRDANRAVELAQKAAQLNPRRIGTLNTLGVAYYRAGNWQEAIKWLDKSTAAHEGGDCFDWYFLAMAHEQLGHHRDARKWFDQANEWTHSHAPENEELAGFRREAIELLAGEPAADANSEKRK